MKSKISFYLLIKRLFFEKQVRDNNYVAPKRKTLLSLQLFGNMMCPRLNMEHREDQHENDRERL